MNQHLPGLGAMRTPAIALILCIACGGPSSDPTTSSTTSPSTSTPTTVQGPTGDTGRTFTSCDADALSALLLSNNPCANAANLSEPNADFLAYDMNAPFWSDGADKFRWMYVPNGAKIEVQDDGTWDFPIGAILAKTFHIGGRIVETRFMARKDDGEWTFASYQWNEAGTDADRLSSARTVSWGDQDWYYPVAKCVECHSGVQGPETAQLNRDHDFGDGVRNQLDEYTARGWFSAPIGEPSTLPALVDPFGAAPLEDRARAYLHTNCSQCHHLDSDMDYRYFRPLDQMAICDEPALIGLGLADPRRLAPGDPANSTLSARMHLVGQERMMPPIAKLVVDDPGTALIDAWISAIDTCSPTTTAP